jgi:hypothetical protein
MTRKPVTPNVWVGAFAALALLATAVTVRTEEARTPRTAAEFDAMFQEINNWRRWRTAARDRRSTRSRSSEHAGVNR